MRFTLKNYQTDAVGKILETLGYAHEDWHGRQRRTAFALSATTGSGKTVIAATVIEALLHGSDEFDTEPDPSATILWVSKDPALNDQTRSRFIECADRIPPGDLVLLDKTYAEESLQTGTVYFINPDKLSKTAGFVKHTDDRHVTFWEILNNTIKDDSKTLYMVLDEAHEGMKSAATVDDQSIVQRIINGNGTHPAVPVVWGISATVKRFNAAMERAAAFTKEQNVTIDPKVVQHSGLLKNALTLDIPDEDGDFSTTMIRDATLDFAEVCDRWDEYCTEQSIDPVVPLLVAQIPNKAAGQKDSEKGRREEDHIIHLVLETIRKHWPAMPEDCVAHVLSDRATIEVGAYEIPKVAPQDIEHTHHIRVLIAKDAVSTGWDCPRAEVLVSLRPAKDDTYVTQLLGRMVRTPLAQQTSVERLNAASCYLPHFDKQTAKIVAEEIMGMREPRSGERGAAVPKVMLKPVTLIRNSTVPQEVFALLESLPSFAKPSAAPRPIKRILLAAQALAQDDLITDADKIAHEAMFDVLDNITAANRDAVESQAEKIMTADIRRIVAHRGEDSATADVSARAADAATVDDALRHLRRLITTSVVNRYLSRNMQNAIKDAFDRGDDPSAVDITAIRARVAALGVLDIAVQQAVEDTADSLTRVWLSTKAKEIAKLPDSRKATYDAIKDMAREPEPAALAIKTDDQVDSVDTDHHPLPTEKKHVLATTTGDYPLELKMTKNRWERATIKHEQNLGTLAAWYRNPSVDGNNSLRIVHKSGDKWKSVQPDFVFVHTDSAGDLRPAIVDPHGAHLGDAAPKLKALAEYADEFGHHYARIIAVGVEKDDALHGLDMKDTRTRRAVYESPADTDSIKLLYQTHGTKYASIPEDL